MGNLPAAGDCIYIGYTLSEDNYAYYHSLGRRGGAGIYNSQMTCDRLAGYLEGATLGGLRPTQIKNGIPRARMDAFEGDLFGALSADQLEDVLERAELTEFYTELLRGGT